MKTIYHAANERGHVNFDWLNSHHSFSFGHFYNPEKIQFGALRVLNDDSIKGGTGFGKHPHDNMEIVSIPLKGALEHNDSTGNAKIISVNDVQIMSAGSGISHSEYNHYKDRDTQFLQVWVLPKQKNIEPRYQQKTFEPSERINAIQTVVAPDNDSAIWINQDAWFSLSVIDQNVQLYYDMHKSGNGVYVFVIDGSLSVNDKIINRRDALGIWDTNKISLSAKTKSEVLIIEVPMINS